MLDILIISVPQWTILCPKAIVSIGMLHYNNNHL